MTATGLGLGNTGSAESTANQVGTPNPNLTGWITGGDGAANDGNFDIQFGAETAIGPITFTDGTTYSMNQVAQMINAASQTAGSYNAASIVYDSGTNLYSLKVSAENNGNVAIVYNAGANDQVGLLSTDFTGTNGAAGGAIAIDTKSGAISALPSLSTAIDTKDSYRAKMGYMMNRLESAVSIVNIQAENLLAAQSRISDVDTATESAAMTRNQVLAQAGIAILAQANTMPQMALQLLK
jgi:flagellin